MTKIKLCGIRLEKEIETVNILKPEYIGFVMTEKSRRCISPMQAEKLKKKLSPHIKAVGVFLDDDMDMVLSLLRNGIIDMAQLHGAENDEYITKLQIFTDQPIIKAFVVRSADDVKMAEASCADYILLDGGTGDGKTFNWHLLREVQRPYFLAGGLHIGNVAEAVQKLQPYAVDVSTGIETNGIKDNEKMAAFISAVRKEVQI